MRRNSIGHAERWMVSRPPISVTELLAPRERRYKSDNQLANGGVRLLKDKVDESRGGKMRGPQHPES